MFGFLIKIQHGAVGMTSMELKCGAQGCSYVTEEVPVDIAWGMLQIHRQDYHGQQGGGAGGGQPPRPAAPSKTSKKPDRPALDMDMSEGEWGIFVDGWDRYKRMTALVETEGIRDELRECCSKQLNTRLVQMHGSGSLGSCDEEQLLGYIKAIAVRGVHKEVHRAAFQGMHQQQGEMYQGYAARLKAKADLCLYVIKAKTCGDDLCNCSGHNRQLYYRDEMVGTQLVAGALNKEHQAKVLSETASLHSLEDKLDRLMALEKSESSSATLSGQVQAPAVVKVVEVKRVEPSKCSTCHRIHKKCSKCQRAHPCTIECHNCKKTGHVRYCCPMPRAEGKVKMVEQAQGEVEQVEAEMGSEVFCMQLQALEFMAEQERVRERRQKKRKAQRAGVISKKMEGKVQSSKPENRETEMDGCGICVVGEAMQKFTEEGIDHMEWDEGLDKFVKTNPQEPPLMEVQVKVLSQVQKQFLGRRASLWTQLGRAKRGRRSALADTGAMVCTAGLDILGTMGIQKDMLAKTRMVLRGVKRSRLTVVGAVAVEISAGGKTAYQILYVTEETKQLILSRTCLEQLGVVAEDFHTKGMVGDVHVTSGSGKNIGGGKAACGCYARSAVPKLPESMPWPPAESNADALEQWVRDYYASSAFNVCEHQPLQAMSGPPLQIRVREGAEPIALHQPIPLPHHWRQAVLEGLERDCRLGVIRKVPAGTPTTWCSRMVVTAKADGSPRRTVDLQALNKVSSRETHHTPSPFNLVSRVPKGRFKSVLDCWNGFHSIPLVPESSEATTFITEFGRYQYMRAPMGFAASGDAYTKRMDDITANVPNKIKIVDDTMLYEESMEECFFATCRYIDLCARNGVVFNPTKFKFGRKEVDFAGFTVTDEGVKPTRKMLEAIASFPKPVSLTGARAWFGLVNQVAYSFAQTEEMAPFRDLLKRNRQFYWDENMDTLFERAKVKIVEQVEEGVKRFEMDRPTCLATDFSKTGLGFFLLQQECQCDPEKGPNCGPGHWKLVLAGSRFLKDAETRYSPSEGELLAIVFGMEQCKMFLLGCPSFYVATDHLPLLPILGDKALDQIKNPRLRSLKEKTLRFCFKAVHVPGSLHLGPDAASRYPVQEAATCVLEAMAWCSVGNEMVEEQGMVRAVRAAMEEEGTQAVTWEQVRSAAGLDRTCGMLVKAIREGFPEKRNMVEENLRQFYSMKEELYEVEEVPFLHGRMLIPEGLRKQVLDILHQAHQGVVGMKAKARQGFWWPGLDAAIDQKRAQCKHCNEMAPSNHREPLCPTPEPEYPWQMAVADYFAMAGNNYLAVADRFTGWLEVYKMDGKAMTLIKTLRNLFSQMGVPEELATDGGPSFTAYETRQFFKQWGIRHRLSAAHYPQSNGRAEAAVKTAKRLLCNNTERGGMIDTEGVAIALLQYRNTPLLGVGYSPAKMLFGRQLKDALPSSPGSLRYDAVTTDYQKKYGVPFSEYWKHILAGREVGASKKLIKAREKYDEHKRPVAPLSVGESVSVQNREGNHPLRWDKTGKVVERLENKQYLVKYDGSGRVLLRTRGHLRKIEPCTRSCSWPDLLTEELEEQKETGLEEAPLLIPGAVPAGRIVHPIQGHGEDLQEVELGGGQAGDSEGQQEPTGGMVEQGLRVSGQTKESTGGLVERRSPRVRKQKREQDFLYY